MLSFLDLPGEIRNQIYTSLLTLPSISQSRPLGDPPLHPQILTTCQKIHTEASQILYGTNTFLAHPQLLSSMPRLRHYYYPISRPSLISLISKFHIRIRLDCDPNFTREQAEHAFSGVEEFTIEVSEAQFGSSDHRVLRLFEGVRGVQRVRVYGSVTLFKGYVGWLSEVIMMPVGVEVLPFEGEGESQVGGYDIWTVRGGMR